MYFFFNLFPLSVGVSLSLSLIWNLDPGSKPSSQLPGPLPEGARQWQSQAEEQRYYHKLRPGPQNSVRFLLLWASLDRPSVAQVTG